jgi:putative ABC transport system permease protein
VELSASSLLPGIGVAILLGVLIGLPPALRAMRLSIVDALANRR